MSINLTLANLTPYQIETLHNIRRTAEHGRAHAIDVLLSNYTDTFQHILDELCLIGIIPPKIPIAQEEEEEKPQ